MPEISRALTNSNTLDERLIMSIASSSKAIWAKFWWCGND